MEVAFANLFGEGKYVPVAWLVSWLPVLFVMPCGECPSPETKRASKSRTKNSPDQFPKLVRGIGRERGESHRNESMTEVSDPFSFPPFLKFTFDHATTTPSSGMVHRVVDSSRCFRRSDFSTLCAVTARMSSRQRMRTSIENTVLVGVAVSVDRPV